MPEINLKTLSQDNDLPKDGFLFGADSQAVGSPSVYTTQAVATTLLGSTSLTGDTLTADAPVLNLSQTWNSVGTTFTGMKFNAAGTSDANSAAASLLLDLQLNTTSKFKVDKAGNTLVGNPAAGFTNTGIIALGAAFGTAGGNPSVIAGEQLVVYASNIKVGEYVFGTRLKNNSAFTYEWSSTSAATGATDLTIRRRGTGNLQLGQADAASPVPQLLSVQSVVANTTDGAGQPFTITGSQSTGTGVPGNILIQTASSAAITGSAQNTLATVATFGPSTLRLAQTTPALDLTQTWNTSGLASGLKINITDTASNVLSGAFEIQYGGSTYARIGKGASGYSMLWLFPGITPTNANSTIAAASGGTYFQASDTNGFAYLGNANASGLGVSNNIAKLASGVSFGFANGGVAGGTLDTILTRKGERNLQLGAADAATALAQTLSVQSVVANTTNGAGANFTINGSQGTGNAAGGSIIFQVAPAGGSGFAQNGLQAALTIGSDRSLTLTGSGTASIANSAVVGNNNSLVLTATGYVAAETPNFTILSSGTRSFWIERTTGQHMVSGFTLGWSSSATNAAGSDDTILSRVAAGVVKIAGTSGTGPGVVVTTPTTVGGAGGLPAAATAGAGARAFVTDASMSMTLGVGTVVVGGGANAVPVYSDGTNWLIG